MNKEKEKVTLDKKKYQCKGKSNSRQYKDIEIYIKRYIKQIEIPITLSSSTVIIRGIHIIHVNYWAHRLRPRCFQARPSSLIRMALNIRKVIHTTYDLNQMTHVYDSVCEHLGLSRFARGNSNSPSRGAGKERIANSQLLD